MIWGGRSLSFVEGARAVKVLSSASNEWEFFSAGVTWYGEGMVTFMWPMTGAGMAIGEVC